MPTETEVFVALLGDRVGGGGIAAGRSDVTFNRYVVVGAACIAGYFLLPSRG